MRITILPLLAGILPFAAATVAHWLGVEAGRLPACIPYLDGCTSISSTGRHPPGSFVFKGIHMPFSAALAMLWFFVIAWLRSLPATMSTAWVRWVLGLGVTGAAALLVYTTFLGTTAPLYEFMRRFGIYVYFIGTVFAQLICSLKLRSLGEALPRISRHAGGMLLLAVLPFVLGLLNFVQKAVLENPDPWENRIEWIAAVAMQGWWIVLYFAWRATNFRITVTTDSTSADSR